MLDRGRGGEGGSRRGRVELTIGISSSLASRNSIPSGGTTSFIAPFPFSASDRSLPPRIDGSNQILYLSGLFSPSLGIPVTLSIAFDHISDIEPILMTVRTKTRTDRMSDQETKNERRAKRIRLTFPPFLMIRQDFPYHLLDQFLPFLYKFAMVSCSSPVVGSLMDPFLV